MNYQDLIHFAETGGLVILMAMFAVAVAYAFWPSNREKFERAANLPLESDDTLDEEVHHG
jgi:cytochrome c oxidase cbb3-type subunit IV